MNLFIEYNNGLKNATKLREYLLSELDSFRIVLKDLNYINNSKPIYTIFFWKSLLEKIPIACNDDEFSEQKDNTIFLSMSKNIYYWTLNGKCSIDTDYLPIIKDFDGSIFCSFNIVKGKASENINFSILNSIGITENDGKCFMNFETQRKSINLKNLFEKYKNLFIEKID